MLFTTIRDFFVQHVFGGTLSNASQVIPPVSVGKIFLTGGANTNANTTSYVVKIGGYYASNLTDVVGIGIGDWLSTTATIVSMIAILIIICLFIKWVFKVVSGAIILR